MQYLTKSTKLKLLIPSSYFLAANILFTTTYDANHIRYQLPGVVIANMAFILWITARVQLGNAFSIAPKSSFLVKTGLYGKLRHPVYYFSIVAVIGIDMFLWTPYFLIIILALTILEIARIRKEEALLYATFGEEYADYKKSTWM